MSSDKVKTSQMCWYLFFFFLFLKSYTCDFVKGLKLNLSFCVRRFETCENRSTLNSLLGGEAGQLYVGIAAPAVPGSMRLCPESKCAAASGGQVWGHLVFVERKLDKLS